jgi:hypothetical protein
MSHAQGSHGRPGHSNMPVKNEGSHEVSRGFPLFYGLKIT